MKQECQICGKAIKPGREEMVLMSVHLRVWTQANAPKDLPSEQDQGWFPVGSDCYRKVANAGKLGFAL